jgi:hypothetical protein
MLNMGFSSRMELSHPEEYALWPGRSDDLLTDLNDPDKTITISRTSDDMLPDGSGWARGDRDQLIDTTTGQNPTSADSWWTKTNCTVDDDGGIVADSTDSESKEVRATNVVVNPTNETYLFQVKVLKGAKNFVRLRSWNATDGAKNAFFDLDNGVEGPLNANPPVDSGMSGPDSEGYYTCWIVSTVNASSHFYINPSATSGAAGVAFAAADTTNPQIYVKEIMLEEVPSDLALGAELVTDGDFSEYTGSDPTVDFTHWTEQESSGNGDFDYNGGAEITIATQPTGSTSIRIYQNVTVEGSTFYKISATFTGGAGNTATGRLTLSESGGDYTNFASVELVSDGTSQDEEVYILTDSDVTTLSVICQWSAQPDVGDIALWESVSVKEVPLSVWTDALGPLQNSGTLTIGTTYQIISTETDHFYAGCAVNDVFESAAETALDANNTVKEVGAFIQPSPYTNASTIPVEGAFVDGWHYVQNATVLNYLPYIDMEEWTASNITVGLGIESPTGNYDAFSLTASAGNGTIKYTPTATTDTDYYFSIFMRRRTGTGNIDMTDDDGSTWTTKTITSSWQRFGVTQSQADPVVGIRIVTDTDAIDVWCPNLTASAMAYRPIPTYGVPAYTTPETVSVALSDGLKNILSDAVGDATSEGTMIVEIKPGYDINAQNANAGFVSVRENIPSVLSHGWDGLKSHDGTTPIDGPALSSTDPIVVAVRWSKTSGKFRLGYKLTGQSWAWELEEDYDGAYTLGTNLIIGYDNPYPFAWRNLRFFNQALSTDFIEANF